MQDYTFSDGTFIPQGTRLASPVLEIQNDAEHWDDAELFKPWRFAEAREQDEISSRQDFTSTSVELHTFGHGRNAW